MSDDATPGVTPMWLVGCLAWTILGAVLGGGAGFVVAAMGLLILSGGSRLPDSAVSPALLVALGGALAGSLLALVFAELRRASALRADRRAIALALAGGALGGIAAFVCARSSWLQVQLLGPPLTIGAGVTLGYALGLRAAAARV